MSEMILQIQEILTKYTPRNLHGLSNNINYELKAKKWVNIIEKIHFWRNKDLS